jgi:ubiquinone/menaquinone biosynthesis C-methylase UbiE
MNSSPLFLSTTQIKKPMMNESKIDYEGAWDDYVKNWQSTDSEYIYPGDEWIGLAAGAAQTLAEYEALIENQFIKPYIKPHQTVLEIGIGGGKTAALLLKYCQNLVCADISEGMLQASRDRLGEERVSYVKLDGLSLDGVDSGSIDVCFCYDTMVHIEPRDIFNYLTQIPRLMRGDRLCLFHHTNVLSELGWKKFLSDWDKNLLGRRHGTAFSIMTDSIMEKFLTHLNYEILLKDTQSVPRDCVWVCRAPAEF